ncbi:hypothetical protein EII34_13685 [Arachnia propionica]|uniref:Uncharacterized protein n=1 Tax=Arachnia propionica TaxID=1750 RepID=A0A3P1T2D2_9ACTN|nr:hypothetical protein [Arachnia propionica]RRD03632.1 hypothetical protein EII34_13685 [Arachnia propionica]
MDTKDLQNLFDRPSGTRLSAATVLEHVEGRRRARHRAAAGGIAVMVAAAVGIGAVHLRTGTTSPGPDVLATPAPPVPTTGRVFEQSGSPTVGSTEPGPDFPGHRCDVSLPDSWRDVIGAAPRTTSGEDLVPVRGGGVVRATEDSVRWERPGQATVTIHEGPEQVWGLDSDSRFVVFQVVDSLLVWDVEHPDRKPWDATAGIQVQENWRAVSEGQLWLEDGATGSILHADLTRGESLTRVEAPADHWVRRPVGGRAQLVSEGRPTLLLSPDGTTVPFEGSDEDVEILGVSGEVHLLSPWRVGTEDDELQAELWSPRWGAAFPIPGGSTLAGDWVVIHDSMLFNHRTGVSVQVDGASSLFLDGEGEDAFLRVLYEGESGHVVDQYAHTLRLSDLPEVHC